MKNDNITLSIVTIAFNDLQGLIDTVASIDAALVKTKYRQCFQHVIVDGGSTDGTQTFLEQLSLTRTIGTLAISESDDGVYDAMNKGVNLASGNFLLFLNAGDMLCDDVLLDEVLTECSTSSVCEREAGLAYSSMVRSGPLESLVKARQVSETMPRMPTIHQSMLYKREILLLEPYHMCFKVCGDFDNFARIFNRGYVFRPVDKILSVFNAGGLSSQSPLLLYKESTEITRKYFKINFARRLILSARLLLSLVLFQSFFYLGVLVKSLKTTSRVR